MWLDVTSAKLANVAVSFEACTLDEEEEEELSRLILEEDLPSRFVQRLQIGGTDKRCKIVLTTKKGVGCRVVGDTLCKLALRYRSIERLPERIFIQATPSVQTRALLTLAALARPQIRREILSTFECEHFPAGVDESSKSYEKRAVALALMRFPGYRKLKPGHLLVRDVRSVPDGLFLGEADRTLVIVEVKKRAPDFEEGASQIVQYYAQAMSHPEFRHLKIQTRLITAEGVPTKGYKVWLELMSSTRELSFLVYQA